jgi:WD40 repeat protein
VRPTTLHDEEPDHRPVAATSSYDETLSVWDLSDGTHQALFRGVPSSVNAVAVGQIDDRPVAVTGSRDGTLRVWDLYNGIVRVIETEATVNNVAISEDSMIVAVTNRGILAAQLEW